MLKIKNLLVKVENKEILKGINLEIGKGEVMALMGPNGSGKSSLANTLIGNPIYEVTEGEIFFEGNNLLEMKPEERARLGIMMAFQYPTSIPGVTIREMLLAVLRAKGLTVSALDLKKQIAEEAEKLKVDPTLLNRNLNEGFSGGEKKKMEILQMRVLKPKLLVLDEVDSGLDIDALSLIAENVSEMVKEIKMSVLVITHYQRLLKYLVPDKVIVLKNGEVVDRGSKEVVDNLEKEGYKIYE
ncbi:MAG: FeS assembly ATPase SufC [Candidatus Collierbacteria bacterium GW2011_GWC2_44_18]|uniref:FeS assembly ATPase SufC n=2 Tax=Microgenomates group TaxID=1794810 RepID=A0A0G1J8J2_9BACT|nr:MAG: FeS assembly ATPase SufC [Microgenomates group bacterium GW2011_GWC1_44_10]KKT49883.1 MAG: FeS assembly ATPase SufC [Candidatus Collierbacteria bacterium GW2011_GWC2_44_18]KKT67668.1 MAG: FeS assembly ATPase SufC [Candidatus Woesebacteria bacterium GW2011_GWA2_44_33]